MPSRQNDTNRNTDLTRGAYVYQELRESLRLGEFAAGEKIREVDICRRFDVSRTPAREALKRLLNDGFLFMAPGGRLEVTGIDIEQAEELFEVRESIEGLSARLAARRAKTPDILALQNILEEQKSCSGSANEFFRINDRFHQKICQITENRYLIKMSDNILDSVGILRTSTSQVFSLNNERSFGQHYAIFSAIERGNTQEAEDAARQHIRDSRRSRITLLMQTGIQCPARGDNRRNEE